MAKIPTPHDSTMPRSTLGGFSLIILPTFTVIPLDDYRSVVGFDAASSTQVLERAPDGSVYLAECHRVLAERRGKLNTHDAGI